MATAKKAPVKKTTTSKSAATKSVSAKKAPVNKAVKSTAPKKSTSKTKASQVQKMKSFRIAPNEPNFVSFKITRQTVYWVILVAYIVVMQLWILSLQIQTSNYIEAELDSISATE
jgi:hypothetical protein